MFNNVLNISWLAYSQRQCVIWETNFQVTQRFMFHPKRWMLLIKKIRIFLGYLMVLIPYGNLEHLSYVWKKKSDLWLLSFLSNAIKRSNNRDCYVRTYFWVTIINKYHGYLVNDRWGGSFQQVPYQKF